jgi:hypothetical protein
MSTINKDKSVSLEDYLQQAQELATYKTKIVLANEILDKCLDLWSGQYEIKPKMMEQLREALK